MSDTHTATVGKERMSRDFMAAVIARRFPKGWLVNLGVGMPTLVGGYVHPDQEIIFTSENGVIGYGGIATGNDIDPDVVNAGVQYVHLEKGAAIVHHADSFALIRRGMNDVTVLGCYEVAENGDFANWRTSLGEWDQLGGIGGAMDLAACAQQVWVMMEHTTREGGPRLLKKCTLPLTAPKAATMAFTDLGVFSIKDGHFTLEEYAPGWTPEEIVALTEAELTISPTVSEVQFPT